MARKRHKPEEIVAKLRQVDVLTAQGQSIAEAVKTIAVTETTYSLASGVRRDEERPGEAAQGAGDEITRLRRAVSDLTLDKLILQEAARGNF